MPSAAELHQHLHLPSANGSPLRTAGLPHTCRTEGTEGTDGGHELGNQWPLLEPIV
jgi:hypothetical protein